MVEIEITEDTPLTLKFQFDRAAACERLGISEEDFRHYFNRNQVHARRLANSVKLPNRKRAYRNRPVRQVPLRKQYRQVLEELIEYEGRPFTPLDLAQRYFRKALNQAALERGNEILDNKTSIYTFFDHAESAAHQKRYVLLKHYNPHDQREIEAVMVVSQANLKLIYQMINTIAVFPVLQPTCLLNWIFFPGLCLEFMPDSQTK